MGFSLQELRVAVRLFRAASDDDVVSLEVVGDTAVHSADGAVMTEEHKSRVSQSNPVEDDAVDLWKTIRNWVDAAALGGLDPTVTTFCLHLSRPFDGEIVRRFADAANSEAASEALRYAETRVWRGSDGRLLVDNLPERTREHVAVVFSADPALVSRIIVRFTFEHGSGDSWADLRQAAAVAAINPDLLDDVLRDVVGWVKQEVTARLQRGQPAAVGARAFRTHLRALLRRLDRGLMLVSAAPGPDAVAIRRHLRTIQTYVQQLELINANDDEKLEAASDYLRASNDRVEWAARGLVHQTSFDEFQDDLIAAWRRKKRATDITDRDRPPDERGMLLYLACCDHAARLNGLEPPPAFCRGSLHALADHVRIGWHPEFGRLLRERSRRRRPAGGQNSGGAEP